MQTPVYRISLSKNNARSRLILGRALIVLAILYVAVSGAQVVYAWQSGNLRKFDSLDLLLFLLYVAFFLTMILALRGGIRPSSNFMKLDDGGLTYVRYGVRQRWPWRSLLGFGITVHPDGARVIEFLSPKASDWRSRLGSWVVWSASGWFARGRRMIRISDQYDAPLQEVVDRLNEYRAKALVADSNQESQ